MTCNDFLVAIAMLCSCDSIGADSNGPVTDRVANTRTHDAENVIRARGVTYVVVYLRSQVSISNLKSGRFQAVSKPCDKAHLLRQPAALISYRVTLNVDMY